MTTRIVFDFAGVLFHWQPARLLRREIPHLAHDEASAAAWVENFFQGYDGDWMAYDRGTVEAPALVAQIAARTGLTPHEVQRVVDGVPRELQPIADSVMLLRRLREEGHTLYFLSNMPAPVADHLERSHDFVRWFRDGVFSARVGLVKPERAIFDLAAERFGARPGELLFLDDHRPNVEAARAAGWHALHFVDAAQAEPALRAALERHPSD